MDLWPHQSGALSQTLAAIARGERRLCLCIPTGGGKTRVACDLAREFLERERKVAIYTNRKLLIDQLRKVLSLEGMQHGVRAAGYGDDRHLDLQISSFQTEHSRVVKKQSWGLHDAELVVVDEAHLNTGPVARKLIEAHFQEGAVVLGLTATPLGLYGLYDTLLVCGTTSELRSCGAIVPAVHYGPDEPDMRAMRKLKIKVGEDLSESQQRAVMITPTLWGRVSQWFDRLNPERRPSILFAPGVRESIWFAEQFTLAGISAAHIDGQEIWENGQLHRSTKDLRAAVLRASRTGSITVLCNRYVLREGIDAPWLSHGIFACVFGSVQSYLQAGGRLLRAYQSLEHVTIQDHGGNWHRHGSLNADRHWELEYTTQMVHAMREERLRKKRCVRCGHFLKPHFPVCPGCGLLNEVEPVNCPQCHRIVLGGKCACGFEFTSGKVSRPVVQTDGSLREMHGDIYRARRITKRPDGPKLWERMYYRSCTEKGRRTFRAAASLFARENNFGWPDPKWPLMPVHEIDWFRYVGDVPRERLTK